MRKFCLRQILITIEREFLLQWFNFHSASHYAGYSILKHLDYFTFLSDHQNGFRKARSTGDLLDYLSHIWSASLWDYGEFYLVIIKVPPFEQVQASKYVSTLTKFAATLVLNGTPVSGND